MVATSMHARVNIFDIAINIFKSFLNLVNEYHFMLTRCPQPGE